MSHKILRLPEALGKVGLSKSTIYNKINEGSKHHDPKFPQPISLGARSIGFIESELDAWIENRVGESRKLVA